MPRLQPTGDELITREQPVQFSWQGQQLSGYAGDSLAAALLAAGESRLGRSFKYGRPRGVYGLGVEDPNAIVDIGSRARRTPNQRATMVELHPDLEAVAATGIPSLKHDLRAYMKPMHKMMRAGFYYKTFISPQKLWPWYEKRLRSFSGLGASSKAPDPDSYGQSYRSVDVLIVGGGLAGLSLAQELNGSALQVLLIDERGYWGGNWFLGAAQENRAQVRALLSSLSTSKNVTLMARSTALALHDSNLSQIIQRCDQQGIRAGEPRHLQHYIRASHLVLTTGAHERLLCFSNNDLPMVMLASALASFVHNYGVCPTKQPVLATNNDSVAPLALRLQELGLKPKVLDCRAQASEAMAAMQQQGVQLYSGYAPVAARGKDRITGLRALKVERHGANDWRTTDADALDLSCDLLAVSGGWNPTVHLDSHTGAKPKWRNDLQCMVPSFSLERRHGLGAVLGDFAARELGPQARKLAQSLRQGQSSSTPSAPGNSLNQADFYFIPDAEYAFIDLQNDVTLADIRQALSENYRGIELVKRYTALGFGSDQGKIGNIVGSAVAANLLGTSLADIGTTTYRPPYTGVAIGALASHHAGDHFDAKRYTPIHPWHERQKVVWELVGQWYRPRYYEAEAGEGMEAAVIRECLAARQGLAIMDASTLGKIDIQGPDARKLLNRVYTNAWSKLAPGCCRYGLMLDENGMVIDDGVTACLADDHFLMTTTTGGAARIYQWLELWLQTEWPDLRVHLNSVTDHWCTIGLVGPHSRALLAEFFPDLKLSAEDFPFMHWRPARIGGQAVRIMRISFSGELSYEINIQANYGLALWEQLMERGAKYNITPYGTESMHVLRAEKGFIIVGQDTDGSMTPQDLGMDWIVKSKSDYSFIGERSLQRSYNVATDQRKQLVGLLSLDGSSVVSEGSQLTLEADSKELHGHVSSSYYSPILRHPIALALVVNGSQRQGEKLYARNSHGQCVAVQICSTNFYQGGSQ